MKYINATKRIKGEEQEYIKAVPENALDVFELFTAGTPVSKKDMDTAHSTLRIMLEKFFVRSAHVSADYLNHSLNADNAEFERLRSAHQLNAVKAFNEVQNIIFGNNAICVDILDMSAVKAFNDAFAVLFRGRFARVDLSTLANKQFTLSSFRECCELFAAFEVRRRNNETFVSAATNAAVRGSKMGKNARKRAARAALVNNDNDLNYNGIVVSEMQNIGNAIAEAEAEEKSSALAEASSTRMAARLERAQKNATAAAV